MKSAPLPADEPERLAALRALRILDTPSEPAFDDLTRLLAGICGVPIAAVSFVDANRQWFKSVLGFELRELPRAHAFCAHAIFQDGIFELPDATSDERFRDNALVTSSPSVRSYFGAPLKARSGHRVGTLCAMDTVPRQLTPEQLSTLRLLARQVEAQLDLRLHLIEAKAARHAIAAGSHILHAVLGAVESIAILGTDPHGRVTFSSKGAERLLGYAEAELLNVEMATLHDREDFADHLRELTVSGGPPLSPIESVAALAGEGAGGRPWVLRRHDGSAVVVDLSVLTVKDDAGAGTGFVAIARDLTESRRVAEGLRQSGQQFVVSFENSAVATCMIDLRGHIVLVNQAICDLLGYDERELVGMSSRGFSHPDDAHIGNEARTAMAAGSLDSVQIEKRYIHKLGAVVWVGLSAWIMRDDQQRPLSVLLQVQDISGRRRTEEALRRESELRAAIVQSTLDGIVVVDGTGAVVEFNPAAEAMFGWKRADVLGRDVLSQMMPGRLDEGYRGGIARSLKTGRAGVLDRRLQLVGLHADGTEFPLELSTTFVHLSAEHRFVGFLRDLTAQKDAEQMQSRNLRQSMLRADVGIAFTRGDALRKILRRCVEAIVEQPGVALAGIWVNCPRSGRLNLAATAGTCAANEAVIAAHLDQLAAGALSGDAGFSVAGILEDPASTVDPAWAAREGLVTFVWQPLVLDRAVVGTILVLGGQPLAEAREALVSIADILALGIQQKRGEDALRIAKETAESALRTKSTFLASMSHELRTPLNAILGFGRVLMEQSYGKLNEMQSDFLNDIVASGEHMLRLVSDLLSLRGLEEGNSGLALGPVQLHDAVEEAARDAWPLANKKAQMITITMSEPLPDVIADPRAMVQVIANLLSNAIKFTREGGAVGVRARAVDGGVALEVHDNGVGIAPELLPTLFDYFEKAGAKNAHRMSGPGVSLALTRALVQRLGGEITVTSTPGVGTVFAVKLRCGETTAQERPSS